MSVLLTNEHLNAKPLERLIPEGSQVYDQEWVFYFHQDSFVVVLFVMSLKCYSLMFLVLQVCLQLTGSGPMAWLPRNSPSWTPCQWQPSLTAPLTFPFWTSMLCPRSLMRYSFFSISLSLLDILCVFCLNENVVHFNVLCSCNRNVFSLWNRSVCNGRRKEREQLLSIFAFRRKRNWLLLGWQVVVCCWWGRCGAAGMSENL